MSDPAGGDAPAPALPGAHLAVQEETSASESIVKVSLVNWPTLMFLFYLLIVFSLQVVQRMFLKSFAWIGIYLLGYYDFSIAWLITPLFLTALRYR